MQHCGIVYAIYRYIYIRSNNSCSIINCVYNCFLFEIIVVVAIIKFDVTYFSL